MIEGNRNWENLVDSIHQFMRQMTYQVGIKQLPNYFVPENNLLDTFSDEQFSYILKLLPCLTPNVIGVIDTKADRVANSIKSRIQLTEVCKGYILDIQRSFLDVYSQNSKINHRSLESLIESLPVDERNDPSVSKTINVILSRCLALYKLSDALYIQDKIEKNALLRETEILLQKSLELPVELITDHSATGYVYLGLFYYLTKNNEAAIKYMKKALHAKKKCSQLWKFSCFPVLLPAGKDEPSYLEGISALQNVNFGTPCTIFIDPIALANAVLYLVTKSDHWFDQFPNIIDEQCFKITISFYRMIAYHKYEDDNIIKRISTRNKFSNKVFKTGRSKPDQKRFIAEYLLDPIIKAKSRISILKDIFPDSLICKSKTPVEEFPALTILTECRIESGSRFSICCCF